MPRLIAHTALAAATIVAFGMWSRIARAELLKQGEIAPGFETQMVVGQEVKPVRLADFMGRKVVLYFYPKDQTPACTREACAFRDSYQRYAQAGVVVLGCSVDTAESHKAFISKYGLPFALLLDPERKIAAAYGAANGIPILGLDRRITYLIDENGKVARVFPHVDPAAHAGEILQALGAAGSPAALIASPSSATPPTNRR